MKEQVVAAMLTLTLALGFIYSIEVLAQSNRPTEDSCKESIKKHCQNAEASDSILGYLQR